MEVRFVKKGCPKHKLPYLFICITFGCSCHLRLCQQCVDQHNRSIKNSYCMKEQNFYKKIEMETDIIHKQYSFLEKIKQKSIKEELLSSQNEQSWKLVQSLMKGMGQQKKYFCEVVDEFLANHQRVFQKLQKCQGQSKLRYFQAITENSLLESFIKLASNAGLRKFRNKFSEMRNAESRYKQFLSITQRYGKNPQQFVQSINQSKNSLKGHLKTILETFPQTAETAKGKEEGKGKRISKEKDQIHNRSPGNKVRNNGISLKRDQSKPHQ